MLSLGVDIFVTVRVEICADVAWFYVEHALVPSGGSPDHTQNYFTS